MKPLWLRFAQVVWSCLERQTSHPRIAWAEAAPAEVLGRMRALACTCGVSCVLAALGLHGAHWIDPGGPAAPIAVEEPIAEEPVIDISWWKPSGFPSSLEEAARLFGLNEGEKEEPQPAPSPPPPPPAAPSWTWVYASWGVDFFGWVCFAGYWETIRVGSARLFGGTLLLLGMVALRSAATLCWPFVALLCGSLRVLARLMQWACRCRGKPLIPWTGPYVESTPTTEELREFKTEANGQPVQVALRFSLAAEADLTAAVEVDKTGCSAINRHGMWLGISKALPCTSRPAKRALRQQVRIHLCRVTPCTECGEGPHATAYACVADPASLEALNQPDAVQWVITRLCRGIGRALWSPFQMLGWLMCCCRRRTADAAGAVQDRLARKSGFEPEASDDEATPCATLKVK